VSSTVSDGDGGASNSPSTTETAGQNWMLGTKRKDMVSLFTGQGDKQEEMAVQSSPKVFGCHPLRTLICIFWINNEKSYSLTT
jgi:hypothetical protein